MFSTENMQGKDEIKINPGKILKRAEQNKNYKIFKYTEFIKRVLEKSQYFDSVQNMWKEFKVKILKGTGAILAVALICVGANAFDLKLGYEAILDGETVGLVVDEKVVYDAISDVKADLVKYMGKGVSYSKEPVFITRIVSGDKISDAEDIKEHLLSHLDYMVECSGIYIGEKAVVALTSRDAAEWVLLRHKTELQGEISDDSSSDFVEKVSVKKGFLHIGLLKTPEEALEILAGEENRKEREYIVKKEDTLWNIANDHGLSIERLLALNEGVSENIKEGDVLKIEEAVPVLSVRTVSTEEYEEEIPFEVEKIKDATLYENTVAVTQKGVSGKNKIVAKITKVNGVETERRKLSLEKISDPVNQVEKVGTKKRPPTTGSGVFINPTVGSLSSRYGSRWNRSHNGIDIAGSYNTPIKAADGGVVTYSGWMSGYGNYIVINHENGYQTAYGHCASLNKKVGDRVAKGDVIAKMGNTGRSTGTHLHFEVKKDGAYQNPLKYVGY